MTTVTIALKAVNDASGVMKQMAGELKTLETEAKKMQDAFDQATRKMGDLPSRIDVIRTRLDAMKEPIRNMNNQLGGMITAQQRMATGSLAWVQMSERIDQARVALSKAQAAYDRNKVVLKQYEEELDAAKIAVGHLSTQVFDNMIKVQNANDAYQQSKTDLANMKTAYDNAKLAAQQAAGNSGIGALGSALRLLEGAAKIAWRGLESLAGLIRGAVVGAFGILRGAVSGIVSIFGTFAGAIGNIVQIIIGFNLAQLFNNIASAIRNMAGDAITAAGNFQTLAIRLQGLVAREMADSFNAANTEIETFTYTVEASTDAIEKLGDAQLDINENTARLNNMYGDLNKWNEEISKGDKTHAGDAALLQARIAKLEEKTGDLRDTMASVTDANAQLVTGFRITQGETRTASDFFGQAAARAEELLRWTKELALQSPFTSQDVANTLTMTTAMGFGTKKAQGITEAVLDFAAGMGLGNVEMTRIIQNFGQMLQQGKTVQREFNDLARGSFVPVGRILRIVSENMGETITSAQDLGKFGVEGVNAFVDAFIQMSTEDFSGASERMSKTFQGLMNKFHDFIETILGATVLGPAFDQITGFISGMFDPLLTPEFLDKSEEIGEMIGGIAEVFFRFKWPEIQTGISGLATAFAGLFGIDLTNSTDIVQVVKDIGSGFLDWADTLPAKIDAVTGFIDKLEAAGDHGGPLEMFKKGLMLLVGEDTISSFTTPLSGLSGALERLAGITGLDTVMGQVTGFVSGIKTPTFAGTVNTLTTLVDGISDGITKALQIANNIKTSDAGVLLTNFASSISNFIGGIGELATNTFTANMDAINNGVGKLSNIATMDLSQTAENLTTMFDSFAAIARGDTAAKIASGISGITGALTGFTFLNAGAILTLTTGVASFLTQAIEGDWAGAMTTLGESIGTIGDSFREFFDLPEQNLAEKLGGVFAGIGEFLGREDFSPLTVIKGLFGSIVEYIDGEGKTNIETAMSIYKTVMTNPFEEASAEIVGHSIIPDMMTAIAQVMNARMSEITEMLGMRVVDWIAKLREKVTEFSASGSALIDGVIAGMWSRIPWARSQVTLMAQEIKGAFDSASGVASPSTKFMQTGRDITAGLVLGILEGTPAVHAAMQALVPVGGMSINATPTASIPPAHFSKGPGNVNAMIPVGGRENATAGMNPNQTHIYGNVIVQAGEGASVSDLLAGLK